MLLSVSRLKLCFTVCLHLTSNGSEQLLYLIALLWIKGFTFGVISFVLRNIRSLQQKSFIVFYCCVRRVSVWVHMNASFGFYLYVGIVGIYQWEVLCAFVNLG